MQSLRPPVINPSRNSLYLPNYPPINTLNIQLIDTGELQLPTPLMTVTRYILPNTRPSKRQILNRLTLKKSASTTSMTVIRYILPTTSSSTRRIPNQLTPINCAPPSLMTVILYIQLTTRPSIR